MQIIKKQIVMIKNKNSKSSYVMHIANNQTH